MRRHQSSTRTEATPIRNLIGNVLAEIERRLECDNGEIGRTEGCGWLVKSQDTVVSRNSFGRVLSLSSQTSYSASRRAMQLCTVGSASTEYNVLYVSRRLSKYDLACNLIAQASNLSVDRLISGRLTDSEWDRLEAALARICDQELSVVHASSLEDAPIYEWLLYASSAFDTTPLLVLDDAALISGSQHHPKNDRMRELLKLASVAANAGALIVLVEETPLH